MLSAGQAGLAASTRSTQRCRLTVDMHAVFASPSSPTNPLRQGPQVCAVIVQPERNSDSQLVANEQLTLLKVVAAAFTTWATALESVVDKAVDKESASTFATASVDEIPASS